MRPCEGRLSHLRASTSATRISTRSGPRLKANRIVSTKVELQGPLVPATQFKPGVKSIVAGDNSMPTPRVSFEVSGFEAIAVSQRVWSGISKSRRLGRRRRLDGASSRTRRTLRLT